MSLEWSWMSHTAVIPLWIRWQQNEISSQEWLQMMPKWVEWKGFQNERPMAWIFEIIGFRPIRGLDFWLSTNRKPRFQPLQIWLTSENPSFLTHFWVISEMQSYFAVISFISSFTHFCLIPLIQEWYCRHSSHSSVIADSLNSFTIKL